MEKGDLAAVILGLSLVIVLMVATSPPPAATAQPVQTGPPATTPVSPVTQSTGLTPEATTVIPTPPPVPITRITYTVDYRSFPVRFLPSDMRMYGFSDAEWQYKASAVFAYVKEDHGGITEAFTVPYPVWRMTCAVSARTTPEKARFRMILVDRQSGLILEGVEIMYPGTVTKTEAASGRPLYMVIAAENVDEFMITFETPTEYIR